MFTIKAFRRGSFVHHGYEAVAYEVDETAGTVAYQPGRGENWPILSLEQHSRIVIENAAGRTVENVHRDQHGSGGSDWGAEAAKAHGQELPGKPWPPVTPSQPPDPRPGDG